MVKIAVNGLSGKAAPRTAAPQPTVAPRVTAPRPTMAPRAAMAPRPAVSRATMAPRPVAVPQAAAPRPAAAHSRKVASPRAAAAARSSASHSMVQASTTYARKYVRRPAQVTKAPAMKTTVAKTPVMKTPAMSAKEAKDRAVKSALRSVATMENAEKRAAKDGSAVKLAKPTKIKSKKKVRRVVFAVLCSAATVGLLAFFINTNMPDISVRVAAMQTGIEASYPTYVPRGYSLDSVTSEKTGQIVMRFVNENDNAFQLEEENSTWDSTALLNNYIKPVFGEYATLREQGVTIYIHGGDAAWVNGGIFYQIHTQGEALTKEQIRNLVTSL